MTFKLNKKRSWGVILLLQLLFFYASSHSVFLNSIFTRFFEWRKTIHQYIFSFTSFSLGDVFYCFIGVLLFSLLILILRKKTRKKASLALFIIINIFYFLYQSMWGSLYFEAPITQRLPSEKISLNRVKQLHSIYTKECNLLREKVHEDKNGVFKIVQLSDVKKEIVTQQNTLPYTIHKKKNTDIVSIKPSIWGDFMNKTGILGYYNPFTAEAQYNANMPDSMLPFTIAHETAHQLGYAKEYEANFIGYLIGERSSNIDLKYSTSLFVLKNIHRYIKSQDSEFIKKDSLSPKVLLDLEYEQTFRHQNASQTKVFFQTSNDLFLKSNRQKGRISYSFFIELFLRHQNHSKNTSWK